MQFFDDVQKIRLSEGKTEAENILKDKLNLFVINDIARASRLADETIAPDDESFAIALNQLSDTQSLLTFDLGYLAAKQSQQLLSQLNNAWAPTQIDLTHENYPIRSYDAYKKEKVEDQKLGLVVYAPAMSNAAPLQGFRNNSIYIIARGLNTILEKYQQTPNAPESQQLLNDIEQLSQLLQQNGFIGYPGSSYGLAPEFSKDYIFELDDYYATC